MDRTKLIPYMGQWMDLHQIQNKTKPVKIGGVRMGCCISFISLNLYGDYLMKKAFAEFGDFKIGGRILNTVRFPDDAAIM